MKTINLPDGVTVQVPTSSVVAQGGSIPYTRITQLAFLGRFTDDEAIDIDLASIGITREAALMRRYLQKVSAATYIDLARTDLCEDLQKLVTFGVLTQERVDVILKSPVQSHEVYKG